MLQKEPPKEDDPIYNTRRVELETKDSDQIRILFLWRSDLACVTKEHSSASALYSTDRKPVPCDAVITVGTIGKAVPCPKEIEHRGVVLSFTAKKDAPLVLFLVGPARIRDVGVVRLLPGTSILIDGNVYTEKDVVYAVLFEDTHLLHAGGFLAEACPCA